MATAMCELPCVDIDKSKYDMNSFWGRAMHFFRITNPVNILASDERLELAREVVTAYREDREIPYVETIDDVWREKFLYDSAFHPDTGKKMFLLGRMSAQVPMNMFLNASMVIFYQTKAQIFFFQWLNQTFNAMVNYTNRSGKTRIPKNDLLQAYCMATFGALATAFSLKYVTRNSHTLVKRMVPFAAVMAANCVNLPLMRQNEIKNGIALYTEGGREIGASRKAALIGIYQVVLSRILMAAPCMILTPVFVQRLERTGFLIKHPRLNVPLQILFCGFTLFFSTPLGCAIFPQRKAIYVENLEESSRKEIWRKCPNIEVVYYNKGL